MRSRVWLRSLLKKSFVSVGFQGQDMPILPGGNSVRIKLTKAPVEVFGFWPRHECWCQSAANLIKTWVICKVITQKRGNKPILI